MSLRELHRMGGGLVRLIFLSPCPFLVRRNYRLEAAAPKAGDLIAIEPGTCTHREANPISLLGTVLSKGYFPCFSDDLPFGPRHKHTQTYHHPNIFLYHRSLGQLT